MLRDKQHWVSSGRCMQALRLAPEACPCCAAMLGCGQGCSDWKCSSCVKQAVGSSTGRELELQALPRQPLQSLCCLGRQIPHFKYSGCLSECQVPSQHSSEAPGTTSELLSGSQRGAGRLSCGCGSCSLASAPCWRARCEPAALACRFPALEPPAFN